MDTDLVERLLKDPTIFSGDMDDMSCFWCGADDWDVLGKWTHEGDCPYVEAMRILGRDLGRITTTPECTVDGCDLAAGAAFRGAVGMCYEHAAMAFGTRALTAAPSGRT